MTIYLKNTKGEYVTKDALIFSQNKSQAFDFSQAPVDEFMRLKDSLERDTKTELTVEY